MQLKWIGDPRYVVGVGGWPAADHDEPDNKVAKAKVKSGLYEKVTTSLGVAEEQEGNA